MNYVFAVLLIGLSGLTAQVLLLRELLVSFYGNELTLGVILANWVIAEAAGAFLIGKFIDRAKNKISVFISLEILFSLALPFSISFARIFKSFSGIPFAEGVGLAAIFSSSFFVILPVSFCHGALFSTACKVHSLAKKESSSSIGRVYTLEIIGTIIGGIIFTYLFLTHLHSFQIAFIIVACNLAICLLFLKDVSRLLKYVTFLLTGFILFFIFTGGADHLQYSTINEQWEGQQVLDYRNSVYGNIVVGKKGRQYTFFYNGIPAVVTPYPDRQFVQEFGNFPLLFHPAPQEIMIIGAGAGGIINEVLKHPVKKLDYAELDPLLIRLLKKYPSQLTLQEFGDNRVNIINLDGRFFLKNTPDRYDIILLGLSKPQDLSTNRLFTQEFFLLAKERMKQGGILSLSLPGSSAYLSRQLKDLNASILNALKNTYTYVRVIPGDYNIFLASDSRNLMEIDSGLIALRTGERRIRDTILIPSYLDYRFNPKWQAEFNQALQGATKAVNQDFQPIALFEILSLWNKQFSGGFSNAFSALKRLKLINIFILIALLAFALYYYIARHKERAVKLSLAYSIAGTGFFSMLTNLVLIFAFQVFFGYLYYQIGILISVFMAGIALGSIIITRGLKRINRPINLFIKIELMIIIFSALLPWLIAGFGRQNSSLLFMFLFLASGILTGLEFPLATHIYILKKLDVGESAGGLYFFDLFGGWLAGIFTGIVFLPILGLFNTCMLAVLLKISGFFLVSSLKGERKTL
ncbi:MAG: spermine synthase [Candidatus Omnitrophota bacterium]|jgi:spermidine synthase